MPALHRMNLFEQSKVYLTGNTEYETEKHDLIVPKMKQYSGIQTLSINTQPARNQVSDLKVLQ